MTRCNCNDPATCHDPESHKRVRRTATPPIAATAATPLVTITMGGGTPRCHDTEPATTGNEASFRTWYFRPANHVELAVYHAEKRDAEERVRVTTMRTITVGGPEAHDNEALAHKALRDLGDGPHVQPSACTCHEAAVALMPPLSYIREWAKQWKAARAATRKARRA